jgi:hypothetical protein
MYNVNKNKYSALAVWTASHHLEYKIVGSNPRPVLEI